MYAVVFFLCSFSVAVTLLTKQMAGSSTDKNTKLLNFYRKEGSWGL